MGWTWPRGTPTTSTSICRLCGTTCLGSRRGSGPMTAPGGQATNASMEPGQRKNKNTLNHIKKFQVLLLPRSDRPVRSVHGILCGTEFCMLGLQCELNNKHAQGGPQFLICPCQHIWCLGPCLRTWKINCSFVRACCTVCMAAGCGPCAETCGLYFSKVNYWINNLLVFLSFVLVRLKLDIRGFPMAKRKKTL